MEETGTVEKVLCLGSPPLAGELEGVNWFSPACGGGCPLDAGVMEALNFQLRKSKAYLKPCHGGTENTDQAPIGHSDKKSAKSNNPHDTVTRFVAAQLIARSSVLLRNFASLRPCVLFVLSNNLS